MPKLDQQAYKQLLIDMPKYVQVWRSNVKDGEMYTYSLRRPDMHLYFSYNKDEGSAVLTIIRQLYKNGRLAAIATLHLVDKDNDSQPDEAFYTSYFFGTKGIYTSLNVPSGPPSANDIDAWNSWMAVVIKYFNDSVEEANQPENVDPDM